MEIPNSCNWIEFFYCETLLEACCYCTLGFYHMFPWRSLVNKAKQFRAQIDGYDSVNVVRALKTWSKTKEKNLKAARVATARGVSYVECDSDAQYLSVAFH